MDDETRPHGQIPEPEETNPAAHDAADVHKDAVTEAVTETAGTVGEGSAPADVEAEIAAIAAAQADPDAEPDTDPDAAASADTASDSDTTTETTTETETETGATAGKRRLGRGGIIAIIVAAVVIVVAVVWIIVAVSVSRAAAEQSRKDAASAVRGYLTSVSHSDASAALTHVTGGDKLDQTLLTDDALKASNASAALSDIHVVTPTGDPDSKNDMAVSASYRLGTTPVKTGFDLHLDGDGAWHLTDAVGKVGVSTTGFSGMTLQVNGAKTSGSGDMDAFPGTYTLSTSTSGFTVGGTTKVVVADPQSSVHLDSAKAELSSSGLKSYRSAVDKDVHKCIATKSLKAGCGLTVPAKLNDGITLVDGTVQRSLPGSTKSKLASLKPNQDASDGVKLATDGIGSVTVSARCTKGSQKGTCQVVNGTATYLRGPGVDMSHKPPKVTWP